MCLICRTGADDWMAYGGPPEDYHGSGRHAGFHTSTTEVLHLLAALVALTLIFTIFFHGAEIAGISFVGDPIFEIALIAFLATGSGFLLHELAHKFVAQWYGHWAEFRAQWWGLLIPIPIVLFTQFIFAAPGAVVISGFVTRKQNGIISAAGPLTNIIIAAIAYPFTAVPGASETFGGKLAFLLLFVNGILALFNLLPFGILDGRKVFKWNALVYLLLVALAVGVLVWPLIAPTL